MRMVMRYFAVRYLVYYQFTMTKMTALTSSRLERVKVNHATELGTKRMGAAVEGSASYLRVRSLGPNGICTRSVTKL